MSRTETKCFFPRLNKIDLFFFSRSKLFLIEKLIVQARSKYFSSVKLGGKVFHRSNLNKIIFLGQILLKVK